MSALTSPSGSTKNSDAPACIRVLVIDGPDRGAVQEVTHSEASIGTAADNDIVLTDPTVSPYHLEIGWTDGIALRDLGSQNGTFINELRIRRAVVPVGSLVRIGTSIVHLIDSGRVTSVTEPPAPQIPGLIATSPAMKEVTRAINRLSPSNVSVLLQGETGTGKDVVARAIHTLSGRANGPFVVVDCGALASTLIASHLFGHERGAFTGADARREGAFEIANGGSIFLDEIGELQPAIQPALLGVLERHRFRRLGGKSDIPTDVRVIAATNRDLRAEVNHGAFRADLYFRLAAARIQLPPLRDRTDDIEPLIARFSQEVTGRPVQFSHATLEALRSQRWSGNVRELRNVVESALALGSLALESGLSEDLTRPIEMVPYGRARAQVLDAFEREYLSRIIERTHGNVAAAARSAHMARRYLALLLKKHRLSP